MAWLRDHGQAALRQLGVCGEARVRVIDDEAMCALHDRTLGDPTTTDVLTFDLAEGDRVEADLAERARAGGEAASSRVLDVDIFVCLDEARRRASELGHAVERELLLYALHGVLHCLGYGDKTEAEAARMHAEEDRVLAAIGVGPVFASGGPCASATEAAR